MAASETPRKSARFVSAALSGVLLCLACGGNVVQAQVINTIAGGGIADGGSPTNAPVSSPQRATMDGAGNLYIADTGNHRIRKVTAGTGAISTVAGNGTAAFSGNGLAATGASLNSPSGVALDSAGNLYIADQGNHRIRKVTASTGVISTVAGNGGAGYFGDGLAATSASIRLPSSVAVDGADNLYIAEYGSHRIRKVTAATGVISTVAGNGTGGFLGDGAAATSARLNEPNDVAVDSAGNLYIADQANQRIRKVTAADGFINTVAGSNGTAGFTGDGAAATSARLGQPTGVAVDGAGNIYIADRFNQRIRKVTTVDGFINTVAGNGTQGFTGDGAAATGARIRSPSGVALDSAGNFYIADTSNHRIRMVTASTGFISTVAGNGTQTYGGDGAAATLARLNSPIALALDASGNVYIADLGNYRIRKVTAATGVISTVAGNGGAGFGGMGGLATNADIQTPDGVAVDSAGNLHIATFGLVLKVTAATGIINSVAGGGAGVDGGLAINANVGAVGLTLDASDNLYIADELNQSIRKVTAATGIISTIAGNGTPGFSGDEGAATSAQLANPFGVAVDGAGNVYIADLSNHRIRKVAAATGIITTVAGHASISGGDGDPATSASLSAPFGVTVDGAGNIYIADQGNQRIRKVTLSTGIISSVAGYGGSGSFSGDGGLAIDAGLYFPTGVALDNAGNIYLADYNNHRIRKVSVPPPTDILSVSKAGPGSGTVTSSPAGIDCGATCSAAFVTGTSVTLTATVNPGSTFVGWSGGGCSGAGACVVVVTAATAVIATFSGPVSLQSAVSRKTHRAAGDFDHPITVGVALADLVSVEPRANSGGHLLLLTFSGPVTSLEAINTTVGAATFGTPTGNVVPITLTGVPDNTRVQIDMTGINGADAATLALGFLVGDVSGSRGVNAADIAAVKARQIEMVTNASFLFDVNTSGSVTGADISAVKARSGMRIP